MSFFFLISRVCTHACARTHTHTLLFHFFFVFLFFRGKVCSPVIDLCESSNESKEEAVDDKDGCASTDSSSVGSLRDFIDDSIQHEEADSDNSDSEWCSQKKRRRVIVISSSEDSGEENDEDKKSVFSLSSWDLDE